MLLVCDSCPQTGSLSSIAAQRKHQSVRNTSGGARTTSEVRSRPARTLARPAPAPINCVRVRISVDHREKGRKQHPDVKEEIRLDES